MSARSSRPRARSFPTIAIVTCVSLFGGAIALASSRADPIAVIVDQATVGKLPDLVATRSVGNPLIADVSLQPGGTMIVTGKGYGATNVMAIDRGGSVLLDRMIQVDASTEKLVTVFRGVNRET